MTLLQSISYTFIFSQTDDLNEVLMVELGTWWYVDTAPECAGELLSAGAVNMKLALISSTPNGRFFHFHRVLRYKNNFFGPGCHLAT